MKWSREAKEALSRVPFFVRKRVKKRVEEETASCGAEEVAIEHVRTCQKRFLDRMEDEVKGFQVETCFGPGGCPNRAVNSDGLPKKLEQKLCDYTGANRCLCLNSASAGLELISTHPSPSSTPGQ